jgi:hypothetical protein
LPNEDKPMKNPIPFILTLAALFTVPLIVPVEAQNAAAETVTVGDSTDAAPILVPASETVPEAELTGDSVAQAVKQGQSTWTAFRDNHIREGVAALITLLVFLWRRFLGRLLMDKLSPWTTGLVTVILGFLGTLPAALTTPEFVISGFIFQSLLTSAEAMLLWSMVGKKVLPAVFGASPAQQVKAAGG